MELFLLCAIAMTFVAFLPIVLTKPVLTVERQRLLDEVPIHSKQHSLADFNKNIELESNMQAQLAKRIPINSRKNKLVNH